MKKNFINQQLTGGFQKIAKYILGEKNPDDELGAKLTCRGQKMDAREELTKIRSQTVRELYKALSEGDQPKGGHIC